MLKEVHLSLNKVCHKVNPDKRKSKKVNLGNIWWTRNLKEKYFIFGNYPIILQVVFWHLLKDHLLKDIFFFFKDSLRLCSNRHISFARLLSIVFSLTLRGKEIQGNGLRKFDNSLVVDSHLFKLKNHIAHIFLTMEAAEMHS